MEELLLGFVMQMCRQPPGKQKMYDGQLRLVKKKYPNSQATSTRMWKFLVKDCTLVKWRHTIPADRFKKQLSNYVEQLWCFLKDEHDSYYCTTLLRHRKLLENFRKAKIDTVVFKSFYETAEQQRYNLEKFKPDNSGYSSAPVYDLVSSSTGRLVITDGPNILTLSKELRGIFKSRYNDGQLVQIDLKTLEPRIALYKDSLSIMKIDDIYTDLIIKDLKINVTRDIAKKIVIASLYGMSHTALSRMLPDHISSYEVLKKIQHVFGIESLTNDIKTQIRKTGHFKNFFGRKLNTSSAFINHFLQSSGVDVSLLIFADIVRELRKENYKFEPIFVIHDALILDVKKDFLNKIQQFCQKGFDVPNFNSKFPVKISNFV
mgnify:FL=1